ncbi:hypothetical protein Q5693_04000 [Enterococcus faecium]|uniref:hypothetical protein n=1 Tax=Enterococcus faecium TaxID=1352 RepID=UPI0030CBED2E
MMEIRWAVKEDLPQINQLITDHPESFVKAKTAADLNDKNKLLFVAVTKENTEEIQKKFAEYLMLEAKKRRIKSIFAQF